MDEFVEMANEYEEKKFLVTTHKKEEKIIFSQEFIEMANEYEERKFLVTTHKKEEETIIVPQEFIDLIEEYEKTKKPIKIITSTKRKLGKPKKLKFKKF